MPWTRIPVLTKGLECPFACGANCTDTMPLARGIECDYFGGVDCRDGGFPYFDGHWDNGGEDADIFALGIVGA